ncbi:hypothetical protein ACFVUQ_23515 [Streptomyces cyaneofuscatus]|uniref:hypothetical protein n=1 Tax=Streptomyces cyaneofuscatus TaxID=66883 RepID=UPI0036D9F2E2
MLFSSLGSVGSVVAIAVSTSFTACFAVACATACIIAKWVFAKTSSADRPEILKQYAVVVRALFTFSLRRK